MNLRAWLTAVRDAFRSMTQSSLMSLASMATVAVSLLVLSVVVLLAVNLDHWAKSIEQQVEIKAYICATFDDSQRCNKTEPTADQKKAIQDQVSKLPGVKEATYVTRDEALAQMRKDFAEQQDILDGLEGDNPLSDMIAIKADSPTLVKGIAEQIDTIPGIRKVDYGQDWVDKLVAFTHAVRIGGVGLVVLLVVATVLTISNTIRLAVYARRREIGIMKLVGATDWYIRRPFVVEGVFLGVFGSAMAMLITGYGYKRLVASLTVQVPFLPMVKASTVLTSLTLYMTLLGAVLGAVGAIISMRRFLKV